VAKRVAITIAGAVSLGSYEAGVLYELLRAIRKRNELAGDDESKKVYIDVLTGASAGAMTAAMVAQRLMYDADALEDDPNAQEPTNSLYEAWVKRISLMGLVRMAWSEPKWHSLFSSNLIASMGNDLLVRSMQKPGGRAHSAVEMVNDAPLAMRVGFALTNMNGIDYMIPITGSKEGGFNYTTSGDQKLFTITGDKGADAANWQAFCNAAVASGAFPAAFRAQEIPHSVSEYATPRLPEPPAVPQPGACYLDWRGRSDTMPYAHCDGGVLQNQPLGIAKDLVDLAVSARAAVDPAVNCDSDDRLYVFVSPHSVKSTAESVDAKKLSIWAELKTLVNVYLRQSTFHDWITAEEMNRKITVLDERAYELGDAIIAGQLGIPELAQAALELNRLLMPNDMQQRLDRLQQQYSQKYAEVVTARGKGAADAYIAALATLEAAAHLENRDKMKIVAVIASEKELAGAGLAAFVGFFRKSFRQHDYWLGRVKTRTYLQRPDVKKILDIDKWPEEDSWKTALKNPSGVETPVSVFSIVTAAIVPGIIFLAIRWVTWLVLAILILLAWGVFEVVRDFI
jgi:Patatin-like phospholipase